MKIYINISDDCTLACLHCYIQPRRSSVLDVSTFLKWFNNCRKLIDEEIEISFYGGEPLLQASNILKIIENTKDNNITYKIVTNLVYDITPEIRDTLDMCSVSTSWDPPFVRFKNAYNYALWRNNCKEITMSHVNIVMTKFLLEIEPKDLFCDCNAWGFNKIVFMWTNAEGNALINKQIPEAAALDDWLCKAYDIRPSTIVVNMFENLANASLQTTLTGRSKFGDFVDISVGPDGIIIINSDKTSIYDPIEKLEHILVKQKARKDVSLKCRTCSLYRYCFVNVKWLDTCPFPKKLFSKIVADNNPKLL